MKNWYLTIAVTFGVLTTACAHAQQSGSQAAPAQPAPCSDSQFQEFDFWVGDWDVFTEDGTQIGVNSIAKEENGCLLVERWTDANGNTGQSYNFVDHASGQWRQVWVSPGLTIDYKGGLDEEGAMTLEGVAASQGQDPQKFRGIWRLQDDDSVRQTFQTFDDEKSEWTSVFVGIYRQKTAE